MIHLPDRDLDIDWEPMPRKPRFRRRGEMLRGRFVLPVKIEAHDEEHAWRIARGLEQLLRDRAPAGVEVYAPELRPSRIKGPSLQPGKRKGSPTTPATPKPGHPPHLSSKQVYDQYGQSGMRWLEQQWREGRVTRSGVRWRVTEEVLDELEAFRTLSSGAATLSSSSGSSSAAVTTPDAGTPTGQAAEVVSNREAEDQAPTGPVGSGDGTPPTEGAS